MRLSLIAILFLAATAFISCGRYGQKDRIPLGGSAKILLFDGKGTSANDVAAVEVILGNNHLNYSNINSAELNSMTQSQLQSYRLLIVPGGNFIDMGKSLTSGTATNIRNAVKHGLNYLGICAGGFLAGKSGYYNGIDLTSGVTFGFYSAENKGVRKAAVTITSPGRPPLDQYWEDGPQFTGWGTVAAKYPDGTPAIVQGACGSGWVILTGVHAEAPEDWRKGMHFNTPATADTDYAARLIRAALDRVALPNY